MDRFVSRTPTWKTVNYSSMAAKSSGVSKIAQAKNKKKPLKPLNIENRITDLLPSNQDNADHHNCNSNDSGLSSASSISPHQKNYDIACANVRPNDNQTNTKNRFEEKENDAYVTITSKSKWHNKIEETGLQVQQTLEVKKNINPEISKTPEKPLHKTNNMIMARIQRDLNSPSAAARIKAIRAIKSPTKSAYNQFDISETEQSLHLPDPPSMKEIMKNIVVYVEVRSGEDNRSAGVRKVIEALGARVSLSLNRETTHVIFKDGLLSTFKKATQMNIPIVSILWIEACKNQCRICDPRDFPISNLDRYENPELYSKMKRVKSMQPDSECNKRIRAAKAVSTPKDLTPTLKTGNLKKTSGLITCTPTSSINTKKTDIRQFFKNIEKSATSALKRDTNINGARTDSPATQLLNRIHSESYTPLSNLKGNKTAVENNKQNFEEESHVENANTSKRCVDAKKFLDFSQNEGNINASIRNNIVLAIQTTTQSSPRKARGRPRRHSLMANCEIETATLSMNTMAISVSTPITSKNRRRSSTNTPKDMSIAAETPSKVSNIEPILEEDNVLEKKNDKPAKSISGRRTLYAVKTMDQTDIMKCERNKEIETRSTKSSSSRRTLYNSKMMETSEINNNKNLSNISNWRRTVDQNEISEMSDKNIANKTSKESELNSPRATKVDKPSRRRRTLFNAQTVSETNLATISPNITSGSSICLTPTNFQNGKVASSTLLENSDNKMKLLETPSADATTGKLLEETGECATPLIFSSTRQPGNRRRTLFDVSMDIITQRLQCINQSARKSLAPPTPTADIVNNIDKHNTTPIITNYIDKQNSTPTNSMEANDECMDKNDHLNIDTPNHNTLKKKRKLFIPNEMLSTPTSPALPCSANKTTNEFSTPISENKTKNSVTKRRRTLMPISQPQPTINVTLKESISNSTVTSNVRKRRSTLDFEQTKNNEINAINNTKASNQQQLKPTKGKVLVYTNMYQQQIDVIREVGKTSTSPTL